MMEIPFGEHDSLGPPNLLSRQDLIRVIIRLQFEGWSIALRSDPSLNGNQSERYMNGRLFNGMTDVRNSLKLDNIYIVETPGVRSNADRSTPDGEPDIAIWFSSFGANDPHALIECKRIDPSQMSRSLRRQYVVSGIDRFISGRYGSGHEVDFMVAYVLSNTERGSMQDINRYLRNVGRVGESLQSNSNFNDLGFVAQSRHIRDVDGGLFRLLHSFLPFK